MSEIVHKWKDTNGTHWVYGGTAKGSIHNLLAEKDRQIAELKERIEELESQYDYECECNKQFVECQNENAELKEQLDKAIVLPNYKKGYKIYYIENHKIEEGYFQGFQKFIECEIISEPSVTIDEDGFEDVDYGFSITPVELTFATLEEAQQALEKLKGEQ